MSAIVVFITAKNKAEAKKIAQAVLHKKLAACVNIVDGIESLFWWEGKIDSAREVLLICKTENALFKKLEVAVKAVHSYQNPEIIALPIVAGSQAYLKWIKNSVKG